MMSTDKAWVSKRDSVHHLGTYDTLHQQTSDMNSSYGFNDLWMVHVLPFRWAKGCVSAKPRHTKYEVMRGLQVACVYRFTYVCILYMCVCVYSLHSSKHIFVFAEKESRLLWWLTAICSHSKHEQRKKGPEILYRLLFLSLNWLIEQYKAK